MTALSPPLLGRAPELALLHVLGETLQTATLALIAAPPALSCEPPPWWRPEPPSSRQADRIIHLAYQLEDAIAAYCRLTQHELANPPPTATPDG